MIVKILPVLALMLSSFFAQQAVAAARNHAVVVSGLGGNPEYSEAFNEAGALFVEALQTLDPQQNLIVHLDDFPTREQIVNAIADAAARMQSEPASVFSLILVGHGTVDPSGWKFNISGPDLTTEDLVAALNGVPAQQQLVVLGGSASGAALDVLSQPGRVVITATKSGGEINAVRFPGFMAEAVSSNVADYDRNEILTVAEAFRFANARTVEYFDQQNLLASEHPRLQGDLADDIPLALLGSLKKATDDPVVAELLDERLLLEDSFKQLKRAKADMPVAEYYSELEILLIAIAEHQQAIDVATGWSETDAGS